MDGEWDNGFWFLTTCVRFFCQGTSGQKEFASVAIETGVTGIGKGLWTGKSMLEQLKKVVIFKSRFPDTGLTF